MTPPLTILADAIAGQTNVATWIRATAARAGASPELQPIDSVAAAISNLSDAGVQFDPIEQLLVALDRACVVTGTNATLLHAAYLRQA